ncbi:MAG: glutamine--tRNA ligase/YqeY domain fusion protein [Betaproteobacteria bacterium]|nr:glutamine--tRNA ligase/YqeY domain fusion protein [Betaproteobacteria bacterium]MDE2621610.1 glutamine--tRNA ligase/YqeY domain fusion protein [Betaproteobacteria bacterium]
MSNPTPAPATNFIRNVVSEDLASGKTGGRIATRFPPEPNGYLHIGHAKSICLNFGIARDFGGVCHMRFDDTNPAKEDTEYADSILDTVRWLGFDWGEHLYYASDYFERCYQYAEALIKAGKAYVDGLSADEIRAHRGNLTEAGKNSPWRDRPAEESLDLFRRMRAGEFVDGAYVLRLKIDMASPNLNLRDPAIYRIRHVPHWRTGTTWCVYPMYDYAHAISDAEERITHSICTLEFEDHRPLYDWVVENTPVPGRPHQYEFARLNLTYTVMSKRKLLELVEEGHVNGWDDPRMPTLVGLRRRGYTPESIRLFCDRIGVSKADSLIDVSVLEDCLRTDLNERAVRRIAVLDPVRLVIENYPEGQSENCEVPNHPQKPEWGSRSIPFSRELVIEREDFMAEPVKGFFRLSPGAEVRLRYAYVVKCTGFDTDPDTGAVTEVRCTYHPDSRSGTPGADAYKVKGNIHWLSLEHSSEAEVRLYDRLFSDPNPGGADDYRPLLNPHSIQRRPDCRIESALVQARDGEKFQFERNGYFSMDGAASRDGRPVFNRAVTLRDSWAKPR